MKKFDQNSLIGLSLALIIGLVAYGLRILAGSSIFDPLVIALLLGLTVRYYYGEQKELKSGFAIAPTIFIPVGIIFYGANNLNFKKMAEADTKLIWLVLLVMIIYFGVIFMLGKLLKQKNTITCLTAAGSAICGASAIAITSPAVDADPEDVSISLIAVTIASLTGFSIIIPFIACLFDISCRDYCYLTGSTLQFTGLVKASVNFLPFLKNPLPFDYMNSLSMTVKGMRYMSLLILIPLFASLVKRKFHVPWFLWAFVASGIAGTWIYAYHQIFYHKHFIPFIKPVYTISWSIAMAAIGLNLNARNLLSINGTKALVMALCGFIAAVTAFFAGYYFIGL